ncbi:MAG: HEPN domain-containing protein [Bacteroidota bacterium]
MTEIQRRLVDQADRALRTAQLALDDGDAAAAVNRAYYAAFHVVRALLVEHDEAPKSHNGVHRRFHFHYVRTGRVEASVAAILAHAEEVRQQADYDAMTTSDALAAADLLDDVQRFVDTLCSLLDASG